MMTLTTLSGSVHENTETNKAKGGGSKRVDEPNKQSENNPNTPKNPNNPKKRKLKRSAHDSGSDSDAGDQAFVVFCVSVAVCSCFCITEHCLMLCF